MSRIVYSCPFVPAEWISAHGFVPSRIIPHASLETEPIGLTAGMCPYAHAFANTALSEDADGIIVSTLCDQMRRISEAISESTERPVFLLNVPHTWETSNARNLYSSEIERLGRFLVRLGGENPTDERLRETMMAFDEERSALRGLPRLYHPEPRTCHPELAKDLAVDNETASHEARFFAELRMTHAGHGVTSPGRTSLGVVGGPLLREQFDVIDVIQSAGGYIALDGTEAGERTMPASFDRSRMTDDPFAALIVAYFDTIPDATRRPNSLLYDWLRKEIVARKLRGIILVRQIWCDNWHAEAQRIKELIGIPFFDLDLSGDASDMSRRLTRLGAFMEMLR